ncbi:MAG: extracellular solute-binding protein [Gemmatimonadaceae bacterium]
MSTRRGLGALAALAALAAPAACGREPPPAMSAPHTRPIALPLDHLRRLMRPLTVRGRPVRVIALYAPAPDYRPTGSPARDGREGLASVDDAARAAVVFLRDFARTGDVRSRDDALGLLAFTAAMEQGDGEFLNFVDSAGRPNAVVASGRKGMTFWGARAVWAMGEAARALGPSALDSAGLRAPLERALARIARNVNAGRLLDDVDPARRGPGSVTATAEALLGVVALAGATGAPAHARLAARMADLLAARPSDEPWHAWGARSVVALARAGVLLGRADLVQAAREEAERRWGRGAASGFPQIAYAASPAVEGWAALHEATDSAVYAERAGRAAAWFLGANPARTAMWDERTGRAFDGIDSTAGGIVVNRNAGAESTIEALLALGVVSREPEAAWHARRAVDPRVARPVVLTYWPAANPTETRLANALVARWNAAHPDVQVRVQPLPAGRSSEEVLLAAIVARATPDVCSNVSSALLARLVRAGGVVRLDDRVATAARLAERTSGAMLSSLRLPDGGIYAFPWKTNPELLLYNVDLLRAAGVAPPRTHAELLDAMRRLRRDTDGDGRADRWAMWATLKTTWYERFYDFYPLYLASSGGRTLVARDSVLFDNDAAVAALEILRQGFAEGLLPRVNFSLGRDPFADGTVAMKIIGPWFLPELEQIKAPGLRYDAAPMPVADGARAQGRYHFADLRSIAVFSTTRHPDEAARFVAYLTSPEADRTLVEEASQLPYRAGVDADPRFARALARWPTLRTFAAQIGRTRDLDVDPDVVEILDVLSEAYEAGAVYGTVSARAAIARAAAEARRIVDAR